MRVIVAVVVVMRMRVIMLVMVVWMVIMLVSISTIVVLFRVCFRMRSTFIFEPELGHGVSDNPSQCTQFS
jgi:hypothetical protein